MRYDTSPMATAVGVGQSVTAKCAEICDQEHCTFLITCTPIDNVKCYVISSMFLCSVHENHRTCRTFPMARHKCLRDFTDLIEYIKPIGQMSEEPWKFFWLHCSVLWLVNVKYTVVCEEILWIMFYLLVRHNVSYCTIIWKKRTTINIRQWILIIVLASHPCTCVLHRQWSQLHTLKLP